MEVSDYCGTIRILNDQHSRRDVLTFLHDQSEVMFFIIKPAWYLHPAAVLASIRLREVENGERDIPFVQSAQ